MLLLYHHLQSSDSEDEVESMYEVDPVGQFPGADPGGGGAEGAQAPP